MACNSCSKTFSLLRKEKGCPSCGYSYCSSCLKYKVFVPKLNSEAKVCAKCEREIKSNEKPKIVPPDAYYRRIVAMDSGSQVDSGNNLSTLESGSSKDKEISDRLKKLKEDSSKKTQVSTEDIADRLQKIKGVVPSATDEELQLRLANIRGVPISTVQSKPFVIIPDTRTEQEQADELMKQYMEQAKIDGNYQEEFEGVIDDIQSRLQKLKGSSPAVAVDKASVKPSDANVEFDDEENMLKKIIEQAKAESRDIESEVDVPVLDELPFCEICNEDAKMRCLGCKYLFCKRCFLEHKDEDDGCDKYETYKPPKTNNT